MLLLSHCVVEGSHTGLLGLKGRRRGCHLFIGEWEAPRRALGTGASAAAVFGK